MSEPRFIPLVTYDTPPAPPRTFAPGFTPGSYVPSFGVPRWPAWSLRVGARSTLVQLTDDRARAVVAGDVFLLLRASGLHRVVVRRVRVVGWEGIEVPVIDGLLDDGTTLAFAPEALYDIVTTPRPTRTTT